MRCEGGAFRVQLASPTSHLVIDVVVPTELLRSGAYSLAIADDIKVEEIVTSGQAYSLFGGLGTCRVTGNDARLKLKRKGPKTRGRKKSWR